MIPQANLRVKMPQASTEFDIRTPGAEVPSSHEQAIRNVAQAILADDSVASACRKSEFKELQVYEGKVTAIYKDDNRVEIRSKNLKTNAENVRKLMKDIQGKEKMTPASLRLTKAKLDPLQYSTQLATLKEDLVDSLNKFNNDYDEKKTRINVLLGYVEDIADKMDAIIVLHRDFAPAEKALSKTIEVQVNQGAVFKDGGNVSLDQLYRKLLSIKNFRAQKISGVNLNLDSMDQIIRTLDIKLMEGS